MRHYTMASVVPSCIIKQPIKVLEVPLSKFSEVVPHHQKVFEEYKATVQKLISLNSVEPLKRELIEKRRTVKQLRDLMYELETLRTQVEDADLDKFDSKTLSLRKIIINLIQKYTELEKMADRIINPPVNQDFDKENYDPFEGTSQIQVQGTLEELKLQGKRDELNKVEGINRDVQDLHEMYKDLNEMVDVQGEHVDCIEKTVDSSQQNVQNGVKELIKAHKLKAAAYPVTGAFLGGLVGGPIGLVAGVKIGGLVAIGCAIVGYTSGRWFKTKTSPETIVQEAEQEKTEEKSDSGTTQKKDM